MSKYRLTAFQPSGEHHCLIEIREELGDGKFGLVGFPFVKTCPTKEGWDMLKEMVDAANRDYERTKV